MTPSAKSDLSGYPPGIGWCRCIYSAHCHGGRDSHCRLAAGGTVNEGGGVCGLRDHRPEGRDSMAQNRTVTYPADLVREIADRLCDLDWNLPGDEAEDIARDIVIDVTMAVDQLRAAEAVGD